MSKKDLVTEAEYATLRRRIVHMNPRASIEAVHFGETDQSIPLDKAKQVVAAYPEVESYFYQAGHGFNCNQRGSYDEAAAKLARERTLGFFRKHLG